MPKSKTICTKCGATNIGIQTDCLICGTALPLAAQALTGPDAAGVEPAADAPPNLPSSAASSPSDNEPRPGFMPH